MIGLLQASLSGLLVGGLFATSALGLSLVLGVTRLVNLVHGDLVVIGSYVAFSVYAGWGLDPLLGLPLIALAGAVIGGTIQRTLLQPLIKHGADASLLTTFALSIVVQNVLVLIFRGDTRSIDRPYTRSVLEIGSITVPYIYLIAFGVSMAVCGAVLVLVTRTSFGRRLRAASEDDRAAAVLGVRVGWLKTLTYALAAATSAVAGALLGMCFSFTPTSGTEYLLTGMAVVVIGGLGSIKGTVVGGLLLGLVEAWGAYFYGDGYRLFFGLLAFLVLLVLRPQGLYGRTA